MTSSSNERPFSAQFPKKPQIGDEVIVKARLKPNAKVFSINFILPTPPPVHKSLSAPAFPSESTVAGQEQGCCGRLLGVSKNSPPYIAYHFKTIFSGEDDDEGESVVAQNWKNVVWQREVREPNRWLRDRTRPFTLIFRFHHDTIRVFVDHTHQAPEYEYEYQVPLERIRLVELWDDVEFVEEVTFRFKNMNRNGT
uniref:Galectin n=1 Tax=Culex tarsalis TaxID=7177 RepID=A0A1Q3FPN1_CULTA